MPRTTRVIVLGLLCLALVSTTLHALPSAYPTRAVPQQEAGGLLAAAWEWLASILVPRPEQADRDSAARSKEGSQLDPNGTPTSTNDD